MRSVVFVCNGVVTLGMTDIKSDKTKMIGIQMDSMEMARAFSVTPIKTTFAML